MSTCRFFTRCGFIMLIAALGCGSQPVPLVAVEGTTIMLAIPGSFPTGYGTAWTGVGGTAPAEPAYVADSPLEDPQRGELRFKLYDDSGTFLRDLAVRLITKVHASPSSRSAVDPALNETYHNQGQTIAFVDIPPLPEATADADYRIEVKRVRRKPGSVDLSNAYEDEDDDVALIPLTSDGQDWYGWGDDDHDFWVPGDPSHIAIHIKKHDGQEHYTPLTAWEDVAGLGVSYESVADEATNLTPYPEFELRVPEIGSSETPPAAWEIDLAYPRKKLRIRGVSLRRASHGGAMVRWTAGNPDAVIPCSDNLPGILSVRVVDPDQLTEGVVVAYQLRNFDQDCGSRATEMDFGEWPGSFTAYDVDGNDVSSSISWEIPSSSFF